MNKYIAGYAGTVIVMVALDMLWIRVIAKSIYENGIGHLMADKPNIPVAAAFYALYGVGLVLFALVPQSGGAGWGRTMAVAALFGFFAYATYDLTNLATLRDWPVGLSLIDIAWGVCVSALSAGAGKAAMDWIALAKPD